MGLVAWMVDGVCGSGGMDGGYGSMGLVAWIVAMGLCVNYRFRRTYVCWAGWLGLARWLG